MSTQHLEPGPPAFVQDLDEKVTNLHELVAGLIAAQERRREIAYEVPVGGQTDVTGFLKVYVELPQGFAFHVHRINVNAINPTTALPYTPAAPYTTGWVGFFRGEVGLNSLFDFAPPSTGAFVFPQISTDGNKQAAIMRGERICMQVTGGPATSAVFAVISGRLEEL